MGPPPAWVETDAGDQWLAYSSFCWFTGTAGVCADYIPPRLRTDLPRIVVARGATVWIHLGFIPNEVSVTIGQIPVAVERSRILELRVRRSGILYVTALHARKGDAGYTARIVVR